MNYDYHYGKLALAFAAGVYIGIMGFVLTNWIITPALWVLGAKIIGG